MLQQTYLLFTLIVVGLSLFNSTYKCPPPPTIDWEKITFKGSSQSSGILSCFYTYTGFISGNATCKYDINNGRLVMHIHDLNHCPISAVTTN